MWTRFIGNQYSSGKPIVLVVGIEPTLNICKNLLLPESFYIYNSRFSLWLLPIELHQHVKPTVAGLSADLSEAAKG